MSIGRIKPLKNILITGAGSFVGTSVQRYLEKFPEKYAVHTVGTRNEEWRGASFSSYDTVFHVAGLAHADVQKLSEERQREYYAVNTELAVDVAKKARAEGVKQFIFMSSAIVYGSFAPIGAEKIITADTPLSPDSVYGESKVQAEKGLLALRDESFRVVILRCPMIYGEGAKGNYLILKKLALRLPLFPQVDNRRSMLYIGNLTEFVRLMIENGESGIFWPCNREWSNTGELVKLIAACHGKKVLLVPGFTWALKAMSRVTGYVNKAFGSLAYEEHLGDYKEDYRLYTLSGSIEKTERQEMPPAR